MDDEGLPVTAAIDMIIGPDRRFYSMKANDTFDLPCTDYAEALDDLQFSDLKVKLPDRSEAR